MSLPPKPKGKPDDLAEVERALSVLQGRHPEHERARREDQEKRARRAADQDTRARTETTQARSRHLRLAAIALPVVGLLAFVGLLAKREMGRRERVEHVAEPFKAFGFSIVDTASPSSTGSLEASIEPGCVLAVSTDPAPLKVTRGSTVTEGASPMLFCTCAAERVSVTSTVGSGGGLVLMRAEAASLGGTRAFAYAPFKPGSTLRADDACADASLDAWIEAKRYAPPPVESPWMATWARRAPLLAAGFKVIGLGGPATPFVVVELPKDSCLLTMSNVPTEKVGLRLKGGVIPTADVAGTLGRCTQADGTVLVSREGSGELVVLVAPATAIGGSFGLREVARANGLPSPTINVPAGDRAWDAKLTLGASQIPAAIINTAATPDVAVDHETRIAALSFETPNALAPETPSESYSYCDPALDPTMHEAICVFSGPQKWRTEGAEAVGGLARSKFPFWLYSMQSANDPLALKGITQLLSLARRLGRDGFSPTTLEALTELPNGVEVLGRTGEDAVVAVGVAASEPWVYTLSDDAAQHWTLDGPPRIVPVKPLEKVTLTTSINIKRLPPKAARRTVIFRRQKR
jgi:hypothetical protein